MGADAGHGGGRAVEHGVPAAKTHREKRRVFVLRWHDRPQTLKMLEVLGGRERHQRPALGVGRVGDDVASFAIEAANARILDAPELLGVALRVGRQRGARVDSPAREAVLAAGDGEVG